jgi:hypothetical protein
MMSMGYAHTLPFFNITTPSGQQVNPSDVTQSDGPDFDLSTGALAIALLNVASARQAHSFYFDALTQCEDLLPLPGFRRETDSEIRDAVQEMFNTTV